MKGEGEDEGSRVKGESEGEGEAEAEGEGYERGTRSRRRPAGSAPAAYGGRDKVEQDEEAKVGIDDLAVGVRDRRPKVALPAVLLVSLLVELCGLGKLSEAELDARAG